MPRFVELNPEHIHPIRWCVQDNDNGPIAYCYEEEKAKAIVAAFNKLHNLNPEEEVIQNGYYRFAYEDMRQYPSDGHLPAQIMAQLALGFFSKPNESS